MARRRKRAGSRKPFRMVSCPGGPILEIPERGRFVFERLSPGTIREPDYYEQFRIIPGGLPGTKLLVACPRGATDRRGKCRVGQRALRIWHPKQSLDRLLRQCKSGQLSRKRAAAIKRIVKDVKRMNEGGSFGSLSRLAHGVFSQDAETLPGRLAQFTVNAVLGTLISITVLRIFFPGLLHGPTPAASGGATATAEGLRYE
jgi:hypothetical protein